MRYSDRRDRFAERLRREDRSRGPAETVAEPLHRHPPLLPEMADETGRERREEHVGGERGVQVGAGLLDEHGDVVSVQRVDGAPVPGAGIAGLGHDVELRVPIDQVEQRREERDQSLLGWRSRTERRGTGEDPRLEVLLLLAEECERERCSIAEPPVDGSLADTGGRGDLVHGDGFEATTPIQALGRAQDPLAVPGGVGALPRFLPGDRERNGSARAPH